MVVVEREGMAGPPLPLLLTDLVAFLALFTCFPSPFLGFIEYFVPLSFPAWCGVVVWRPGPRVFLSVCYLLPSA